MANVEREQIEWCTLRWNNATDRLLPRVLLIGDSITNGYSGPVAELLEDRFNVDYLATAKSITDPAIYKEVDYMMDGYEHAVIHFNNGLHGWHIEDYKEYGDGLRAFTQHLKKEAPGATMIWASSTPVRQVCEEYKLFDEKNDRVVERNRAAAEIMHELNIPVDDLYRAMLGKKEFCSGDTCHYNQEGQQYQGSLVADSVLGLTG